MLEQELASGRRLIAENQDFAAFAPFASRFPFEMRVLPKFHGSAFSQITSTQGKNLAQILRNVLQKLDRPLGRPPYNLSLQGRPFLRPRKGYWETIEADFHWHLEILPQVFRVTGFEWGFFFFLQPGTTGNRRAMPYASRRRISQAFHSPEEGDGSSASRSSVA